LTDPALTKRFRARRPPRAHRFGETTRVDAFGRPEGTVSTIDVKTKTKTPTDITVGAGPKGVAVTIEPGRVFDRTIELDDVPDGYRAMADRQALKVLIDL
jgi:hypothetical protein